MVKLVLINGTFIPGVQLAVTIGDSYTNWIIDQSLGGNADQKLGLAALSIANLSGTLGGPGVPLLLVLFACVFSLLQLIIMYFRAAVLVLLAGTIALPASTAVTGMGSRWLSKWLSWTLAFILLKPAAATVFAAARLMGSGTTQDLGSGITGFVLLSASVIVLPALLKLMQPAGVALTSGGSFGGGADAVGRLTSMDSSGGPSGSSSSGMSAQSSPATSESPTGSSNVGLSQSAPSGGVSDGGSLGSSAASAGTKSAGAGTASSGAGTASAGTATAGTATAGTGSTVAAGSAAGPVGVGVAIGAAAAKAGKDKVLEGFEEATDGGGPSGS
ncbi:hypothetical protein [Streptomyces sioyaensis]|uniref:hypothetical protein n=1 Tax=Streptomyces sioyaensis TaxID=67364 RepID=UPI0036E40AE6